METKNIKEGWRQVKLGDIVKWTTGKLDSNAMIENGMYPYFTCSQETFRINEYAFDQEAVLLGGNNAAGIFPLKYYKGKFNAYQRTYVMSAIDNEVLDNKYLYYALIPELISFKNMSTGATTKFLTKGILDNFEITLPLLQIQKYIAGFLSNYDNLIENNNRRIQILEQTAQEIYKEWFVNFRFPGHETIKMSDSGTDFGEIPEGWEIVKLNTVGKVITGKTPSTKDSYNFGNYMPFIKTPDLHGNIFCIKTEQCLSEKGVNTQKNKILPANSLIVSCIGTVGVVSITSELSQTNQQINTLVLEDLTYLEYLYLKLKGLKQHLMNIGSNGATMTNVNKDKFENIEILVPSNDLMKSFNVVVNPLFKEILIIQNQNSNLTKTRDLLLPRLISGEIDVLELEII